MKTRLLMKSTHPAAALPCGLRRGFTLIELLVTMALLAIMLALAAPSFVSFQRNSELTATANSFVAALSAARAEAMKRQMRTFVVPASGNNWATGWTVFVDVDNSATAGSVAPAGADIVVLRQAALPASVTVTTDTIATPFSNGGTTYAMFNGSGFMTTVTGGLVPTGHGLELRSTSLESRRIIANSTGRLRVCKPATANDASCSLAGF